MKILKSFSEYYTIEEIPIYNDISLCNSSCTTTKLDDKQVIWYLENKIKELEKVISLLKEYCGNEYIEAVKELEIFLENYKVGSK